MITFSDPKCRLGEASLAAPEPAKYLYAVWGLDCREGPGEGVPVSQDNAWQYVSSFVGHGLPSGFNAVHLALEDGLIADGIICIGKTDLPVDDRLIGVDPGKKYIPKIKPK